MSSADGYCRLRSYSDELEALAKRVSEAREYLKVDRSTPRLAELEAIVASPDLWNDPERGRTLTGEYNLLLDDKRTVESLETKLGDLRALEELLGEDEDPVLAAEYAEEVGKLSKRLDELEMRALFSGEHDESDAILEIKPRAGGTDAQDWAEMLVRMYQRWADTSGYEFEIDDISPGQEAGILSATIVVRGRYAYGMLQGERGVHRLVRMSPFNAKHSRETSFALVQVFPLTEAVTEVQIDEKELRIDTYRSSGAGGQHVNVTDSAVRITHLPTGIVVSCQNERSQHQNKAKAMQFLAAKLLDLEEENRRQAREVMAGSAQEMSWGNQIRSYVLAPYQLVKDLRTGFETGAVETVLNGEVSPFMEAYLRWNRSQSH